MICNICKKHSADCPSWPGQVWDGTCNECKADAKLGRLVRGMPKTSSLYRGERSWRFESDGPNNWSKTPEEALENAGGVGMNSEKIPPHCPPDDPCIWCREESLKARLEEVARERDEAREQLTDFLMLMLPRPAGEPSLVADTINVPLTGSPLVLRVIEAMVSVLKEGPGNFRAISFRSAKDGQEYSLTIQKEGGKTPAQRLTELECEAKDARQELMDLRRKIGEWAEMISLGQHWEALREMREEDR